MELTRYDARPALIDGDKFDSKAKDKSEIAWLGRHQGKSAVVALVVGYSCCRLFYAR